LNALSISSRGGRTFVYQCSDRIVIHGYLSGLSWPEQVVHFVRHVLGIPVVSKETLSRRTDDYRDWVEAYSARKCVVEPVFRQIKQARGFANSCCAEKRK
jgi:hypothetical protein